MAVQLSFDPRRAPVTAGTILGAVVLSLAFWAGKNMSWAFEDDSPIWRGQLWRLLTSTLVHANFIHLAFNLYWLAIFGAVIEPWLGSLKTLLLYVVLALSSSAAEFLVLTGGIGLSGVVYGCFGLLYAAGGRSQGPRFSLHPKVTQLFVGWFFLCIVLTYAHIMQIANVAHGVGAVSGYVIGLAILSERRRLAMGAIAAGTLALCLLTLYMPWRYQWWWERGLRMEQAHDAVRCRVYWQRAIELAGDNPVAANMCLVLAAKEADAGNLTEADALFERGVRMAVHPENLRAWQAYYHWSIGDTATAARYLAGVRLVDLDEDLRAVPAFVRFTERTMQKTREEISTQPATQPESEGASSTSE